MGFSKIGLVFLVVFVGLSSAQKLFQGVKISPGDFSATLLTGVIAAVVFVFILRLVGK